MAGPPGPPGSAAPGGRRGAGVSVGSDVNLSVLGKIFTEWLGHATSGVAPLSPAAAAVAAVAAAAGAAPSPTSQLHHPLLGLLRNEKRDAEPLILLARNPASTVAAASVPGATPSPSAAPPSGHCRHPPAAVAATLGATPRGNTAQDRSVC